MSLYGALFAGVSGLASQSSAMGAIADNVTNVNTVGYKGSKVNFQTLVTKQVSLTKYSPGGVQSKPTAGIDVQGLLQATTSATDVGISGKGFFIVNGASEPSTGDLYSYTRAGSFKVDKDGYLRNVSGFYLQGWPLQTWDGTKTASTVEKGNDVYMKSYKNAAGETTYINDNVIDSTNLQSLNLNTIGGTATATTTVSMGANLPAGDDINATHKTNALIYDSLGNSHNLNYTWIKKADNAWNYTIEPPAGAASIAVKDQDDAIYFSAGRLDFRDTGIPKNGANFTFDGQTVSYLNGEAHIDVTSNAFADGDTFTITIDGTTETFEFDNNAAVGGGNNAVTIGASAAATAQNLRTAIETAFGAANVNVSAVGQRVQVLSEDSITVTEALAPLNTPSASSQITPRYQVELTGSPADGDTVTVTLAAGNTITFEWDNNGVVNSGNVAVTFTGTPTSDASTFASSVQAQLESALGPGTWAQAVQGRVEIGGPSGMSVSESTANLTASTVTITAPAAGRYMNISPSGKTMSQIVSQTAEITNQILVGTQDVPPTVPGYWSSRIAGTTGIIFHSNASNDITFDTTNLTDSNGDIAVLQSDTAAGDSFTVNRVSGSIGWLSQAGVTFNGDGTPDTFFTHNESTEPDPRGKIHINWTNGALDMDDTTVASGGSPAITQFLGNYNTADGLTQLSGEYQINYLSQNGANFGNFAGVSIGEDGVVTALFDNGVTRPVFMIPLATFVNPNGMESLTGNSWIETDSSGQPTVREAGSAGAGTVAAAALESSTVDLGEEFTTMITTQRAYSAAAKIITTSDEMLDELVRIKR